MKPIAKGAGSALCSLLMAATLLCVPLYAASNPEQSQPEASTTAQSTTGFYVAARLPENQDNDTLSYFSLQMEPGQQQTLEVDIYNESDTEITVDVDAISASTNPNGIIDYRTPDIRDETLRNPFSELAQVEQTGIQVPAGGSSVASVTVTMPEAEYDGAILGSLVFTKRPSSLDMDEEENGAAIQNVYHYAVGVVLRENDNEITPEFELLTVETNLFNNQPAFILGVRNREPYIVKDMEVIASVYQGDTAIGTPYASRTQDALDMAPNSVLNFAVIPQNETLEGGLYTAELVLRLEGEEWRYTTSFTVQDDEATLINDTAPFAQPEAETNPLLIALIVLAALLLIALIVFIILLLRRRRRDEDEDEVIG